MGCHDALRMLATRSRGSWAEYNGPDALGPGDLRVWARRTTATAFVGREGCDRELLRRVHNLNRFVLEQVRPRLLRALLGLLRSCQACCGVMPGMLLGLVGRRWPAGAQSRAD